MFADHHVLKALEKVPEPDKPLKGKDLEIFVRRISEEISRILHLKKVKDP